MKRYVALFIIISGIAVLASFFASEYPDGLEFVAEKLGFLDSAAEGSALMTDYHIPHLGQNPISTALSGLAGILICWGLFWAASRTIRPKPQA